MARFWIQDRAEDAFLHHTKIGLQEKGLIQDVQNFAKRNLMREKEEIGAYSSWTSEGVDNLTERYHEHP